MTGPRMLPADGAWPLLMDRACLARYLSLSDEQLHKLLATGRIPQPYTLTIGARRWWREQVDQAVRGQCSVSWGEDKTDEILMRGLEKFKARAKERRETRSTPVTANSANIKKPGSV